MSRDSESGTCKITAVMLLLVGGGGGEGRWDLHHQ